MDTGVGRVRGRERGAVVMEYITPMLYPAAFTDTAARVLQTVSRMGVWMVAPADLNGDQLRALLTLRNLGYIEYAAYGGYRIRANEYTVGQGTQPPAAPVTAIDFTGAVRISVSASSHRAMIVWSDRKRKPTEYPEGTSGYEAVVAYGKTHGLPTVWRMAGTISYVLGKAS